MAFWLGAVALEFPRTYWDDSLIIGPAISLAEWGRLENIYLSKNFYSGYPYLFYPPVFFWILAGWILAFGRDVASFNMFWAACGITSSIALALLLTRLTISKLLPWLVAPFMLFGCIAYTGYRFEMLGLATLLTGIMLCTYGLRSPGYFLLFVTPTIAPTFLGVCAVTASAVFLIAAAQGGILGESLRTAAMLLACSLLLIASVSGHIVDLIATMHHYKDVRIGLGGRGLSVTSTSVIPIGLNLVSGAIQYFALKQPIRSIRFFVPFIILISFEVTLITHARPITLVAFNIATLVVAAATFGAMLERLPILQNVQVSSLLIACIGCFLAVLNVTYVHDVAIRPLSASLVAEARVVAATAPPDRILVVDAQIMKDVLGYPTSRTVEDSMVRRPMPSIFQDYSNIPENEYLIMARSALLADVERGFSKPYRGLVDRMFIATGMQRQAAEGICVIDAKTAPGLRAHNPAELAEIACGVRSSPRH